MIVRLISTAQTGYFYTTKRLRTGPKLAAVKYDPTGTLVTLSLFQILMRRIKLNLVFSLLRARSRRNELCRSSAGRS